MDEEQQRRLHSLRAKAASFVVAAPNGKYKLLKRLGRKLTFWYVHPFGEAQNQFNSEAAESLEHLQHSLDAAKQRIAELEAQTERRIQSIAQMTSQKLEEARAEQQQALQQLREEFQESLCIAAPESRRNVGADPLTVLPPIQDQRLTAALHAVQQASQPEETEAALQALDMTYTNLLTETVQQSAETRRIVLVCRKFTLGAEAIRNEMYDLFLLLRHMSRYPVCILSIEEEGSGIAEEKGEILHIAEDCLADWMRREDPALLILFESTPAILNAGKQCMLLRNCILRVSAQNPVQGLGGSRLQELLHLCDYGIHRYCTASRRAADRMEETGFRRPAVMYPYLRTDKPIFRRTPRAYSPEKFTVGFASSPLSPEQSSSRGAEMLCQLVQENPEIHFVVLWRDSQAVPIPPALSSAANCTVKTGQCDMAEFYSEIDCVLIPYQDEDYNHACPLSAVEGMLLGIPAAATPVSGISEIIAQTGMGEIAEDCSAKALSACIQRIREQYEAYGAAWRREKLKELLSGKEFVHYVESAAAHAAPYGTCTIYEWDRQLKLEGKHLVKGHPALKAYYQRQEVAEHYTADRFSQYPQNCFDLMERQSVAVLLRHFLGESGREYHLLDLACGPGRILETLLPFGQCVAGDASPAMLRLVQERFPEAEKLQVEQLDLLDGPPEGHYDAVTIFRFLRHYEYSVRKKLWGYLRGILTPEGVLLFDVPNLMFEIPHRRQTGWGKYNIYDVFWTEETLRRELEDNGLRLAALVPVGRGLYAVPEAYRGEPMTWTAAVQRITKESEKDEQTT